MGTLLDISLIRLILVEYAAHYAVAPGIGQQLVAVAQEASGGYVEQQPYACAVGLGYHIYHLGLAAAKLFHYRAHIILRHVYGQLLDGLKEGAVRSLMVYYLWAGYGEFVVLPSHLLYQYGEMQLAAASDAEHIGAVCFRNMQSDVALCFFLETCPELAAGDWIAIFAGERRIVDEEHHFQGWFFDLDERHWVELILGADGFADVDLAEAADGNDLTDGGFFDRCVLEAFEAKKFGDAYVAHLAVAIHDGNHIIGMDGAAVDGGDGDFADKFVVIHEGDLRLQRSFRIALWRWDVFDDGIEERLEVIAEIIRIFTGDAFDTAGVKNWEVELIF